MEPLCLNETELRFLLSLLNRSAHETLSQALIEKVENQMHGHSAKTEASREAASETAEENDFPFKNNPLKYSEFSLAKVKNKFHL